MLPAETRLELRSCPAARNKDNARSRPPLLFVHGGYCDSWCWEPYFLPFFAGQGFAAHALSLRGHGASGGHSTLFVTGLDDYAADVERVVSSLPEPPILVGHSMGAAVIERLMSFHPVRAAALLAPVPPTGLLAMATRLAAQRPDFLLQMSQFDPGRIDNSMLEALRPLYFSDHVDPRILLEAGRHLCLESPRALLDLSMRLHWQLPERGGIPLLVLGAADDRICTPEEVRATAGHHGIEPLILPGLAHMLMLDRSWKEPARALLRWLTTL
jgi:pimeloyl-ACP methyl ester carboxylesterase